MLVLIVPTYLSFVSSSTGYIRINSTSTSISGQRVQAGGNVNLYFGGVVWSSNATFLFLSTNGQGQITSGDFVFTPKISVHDLTNTVATAYTSDSGNWIVGSNWVNGSIAANVAVGNYYVKAFDQASSEIAVTDTYITVYSVVYSSTLSISPSTGPGGVPIQFTGLNYPPSSTVTITYYDPTFSSWNYLTQANADSLGQISVSSQVPDLKKSVGNGDFPEAVTPISYRSEIQGIVYSYVSYDEYSRGLKQVGSQTAYGLFGNGTSFGSSVKYEIGDNIVISGKWWHPNSPIYIRWDSDSVVGTVTSDQWLNANIIDTTAASSPNGTFSTLVTIPNCQAGEHYLAVEDSQTRITVKIFVSSASLAILPSSGAGGIDTQFTGSGYLPSSTVIISYRDPTFSTWNQWMTTTSDSSGNILLTAQIPDLKHSLSTGNYSEATSLISFRAEVNGSPCAYVDFKEYWRGLSQVGSATAYGLFGNGTDLSSSINAHIGDSLLISGKWFHPGIVYIRFDGTTVVGTVSASEWAIAGIIGSTTASSTGSFSVTVTIPTASGGSHFIAIEDTQTIFITKVNVSAPVIPISTPTPSSSPTSAPTTTPKPTPNPSLPTPTIDLSCKSTTRSSGFTVQIMGKLFLNGVPLTDIPVQISYSVTGGNSWQSLTSVKTLFEGTFIAVWNPDVTGNYLIDAAWEGNSSMNGVSKSVTFAITPDPEQNVFTLTSNSTITQFAFNPTSKELSFTASGPSGTTGYVNIYIPKTLISDITTLKTYIDGREITYNSESQTDSWLISFSYSHSQHIVTMELGSAAQSSSGGIFVNDWQIYALLIMIIGAVVIATTVYKVRRGRPAKRKYKK